jgi:hypothetical protein
LDNFPHEVFGQFRVVADILRADPSATKLHCSGFVGVEIAEDFALGG